MKLKIKKYLFYDTTINSLFNNIHHEADKTEKKRLRDRLIFAKKKLNTNRKDDIITREDFYEDRF